MSSRPWILISIGVLILLLGVLAFLFQRKKKHKPDYYVFFIMGVIWLPIGFAMKNYALSAMGLIFAIVGFLNKDKWKKNHRTWSKMDKDERMMMLIVVIGLGVLVLAGLVLFLLTRF